MNYIEDKLLASVKFDAINGDSRERAIMEGQVKDAIRELAALRVANAEKDARIAALEARVREVEGERDAFASLVVRMEHDSDGGSKEYPATPASLKSHIDELQSEWDATEKRASKAEADRDALRGEVERLRGLVREAVGMPERLSAIA